MNDELSPMVAKAWERFMRARGRRRRAVRALEDGDRDHALELARLELMAEHRPEELRVLAAVAQRAIRREKAMREKWGDQWPEDGSRWIRDLRAIWNNRDKRPVEPWKIFVFLKWDDATGGWKASRMTFYGYLVDLMQEDGIEVPSEETLRKFCHDYGLAAPK